MNPISLAWIATSLLGIAPDGLVRPPRDYKGSLEEHSQEAVLVLEDGAVGSSAIQHTILKIETRGATREFSWIVPFPAPPQVSEEDPRIFAELFGYVESQLRRQRRRGSKASPQAAGELLAPGPGVQIHSDQLVGSYRVAVISEEHPGTLNAWLEREGYQPIRGAKDTLAYYRSRGFCFACIKVAEGKQRGASLHTHPLRFRFRTGSPDAVYFPMKLTGLQRGSFNVNLYVFRNSWINHRNNRFGCSRRGFHLRWRDYDGPRCKPNTGKNWGEPERDPYLRPFAARLAAVSSLFRRIAPGKPFYLTNIQASGMRPGDVRRWDDDLWITPFYTDFAFVPLHYQRAPYNLPAYLEQRDR